MVIKSQILAGGRGLGRFTNGLQGGVHIADKKKALDLAKQMLGGTLVTKQTGPAVRALEQGGVQRGGRWGTPAHYRRSFVVHRKCGVVQGLLTGLAWF